MAIVDSSIRLREIDKILLVDCNLTRCQLKVLTDPHSHISWIIYQCYSEWNTGHLSWVGLVAGCKLGWEWVAQVDDSIQNSTE